LKKLKVVYFDRKFPNRHDDGEGDLIHFADK